MPRNPLSARGLVAIIAVLLGWPLLAPASMRCGSRIVDDGNLAAEVLAACGQPAYIQRAPVDPYNRYGSDGETWFYDFGPQRLLNLVRFRDGRVSEFETDGYGLSSNVDGHCTADQIREGMSEYRLIRECGSPLTRRAENVLLPLEGDRRIVLPDGSAYSRWPPRHRVVTPVTREEWVYNFGSSRAMRRVILEDGEVTYVEAIDRGFDR